jgi:hypothetical protein
MLGFFGRVLRFLFLISLPIMALAILTEALTHFPKQWGTSRFWLEVFVDTLPFIAVIAVIYWLAGCFVREVYRLDSVSQGIGFLIRCQFGRLSFGPWIVLQEGKIHLDFNRLVRRLGGPGGLVILNDTALVLERAGRLTRVEGPGFPALERFESIYDIIDLRPKRREYTVSAMTKEGIVISWKVEVQYKIADDNEPSSEKVPYPHSKEAIFKAVTGKWRRESGREQDMDWEGWLIISQTEATLRSILARRFLDELIGLTEHEQIAAREAIQAELEQELQWVAPEMGAQIIQVKLDNLKVDDNVLQQWIEDWRVRWQQTSENQLALEQAKNIQTYEPEIDKASQLRWAALAQTLQGLGHDQARSILVSQLFEAISQTSLQEDGFYFLPAEAMTMLEGMIQNLNNRNIDKPSVHTPEPDISYDDSKTSPDLGKKSPIPFKPKIIPITGRISAGQEKSFLGSSNIGYIAQINEDEFVVKGCEEQPLKALLLKGSKFKLSDAYEYFAVRVSGDSMDQAGIASGDYVILRKPKNISLRPANGDIVAVVFHNEDDKTTLKRICFGSGINGIILRPESSNPNHRSRILSKGDFAGGRPRVEVAAIAVAVLKPQSKMIS